MQTTVIHNCYDSHTHFWATGQVSEGLQLWNLQSAQDVLQLKIQKHHLRGNWIVGFGWNENNWLQSNSKPQKDILDQFSQDKPVFFSRADGHASWINSKAIEILKLNGLDFSKDPVGGRIERNEQGEPSGLLYDQAHIAALNQLPDFDLESHKIFFKSSQKIFNQAGFTHVRDLSMNEYFWNILQSMEDQKDLTLCLEAFVTAENIQDADRVLAEIKKMKNSGSKQLRVKGIKIFIDGSLGSKTAALSENYLASSQNGLLIWTPAEIKELIRQAWAAGEDVAIHTIGDRAVEIALKAAREVSAAGVLGRLHLEHVQLLNADLIKLMKPLHITCYMQPCHWLSDAKWLKTTLSEKLIRSLFQWELLRKNKIPFYFGSDSPIEKPSLFDNLQALTESANWGVPALQGSPWLHHQHPDTDWCPSETILTAGRVEQVLFNGQKII